MLIFNSFTYLGPNRRSDFPVHELSLVLTQARLAVLKNIFPTLPATLNRLLSLCHLPAEKIALSYQPGQDRDQLRGLASLFAESALLLQRCAGHSVQSFGFANDNKLADIQVYFEYDDQDTAVAVADFCVRMFTAILAEDQPVDIKCLAEELEPALKILIAEAAAKATPADTRAILAAANMRGIPWIRMEKTTYEFHDGDFRLRKNSLINLGYGRNRKMVDSTFCVDNSFSCFELIRDREKLVAALAVLNIPMVQQDIELGARSSVARVARAAEKIGYPVTLKTSRRQAVADTVNDIRDRSALETIATQLLGVSPGLMVERYVAGSTYRIVVANLKIQCVLIANKNNQGDIVWASATNDIHPENITIVAKIANYFPVGIVEIRIVCADLALPIEQSNGAVVDVKLAPVLDDLSLSHPQQLQHIALAFVDWMYPDPTAARIPIVAVTGTNGKTSTCRIIDSIFRKAGYRTGLACTDAIYVDSEKVNEGDFAGFPGHLTVLNASMVEAAILESARGGVIQHGLGFDKCDVGVCLNVTEDHLGEFGINTIEDMTKLKMSIVARAAKAVVLNADSPECVSMKAHLHGRKICFVSNQVPLDELRLDYPDVNCFAAVIHHEGTQWLAVQDEDTLTPVIPVAEIPATWNGAARQYVSNSLHAMAASYLADLPFNAIRAALAEFSLSYAIAPGRLNIHQGGGITVIMDFAQNPDSLRELIKFAENFENIERRIIGLSCSAKNTDALIRETALQAAGKFDRYVCKNFKHSDARAASEVPLLLSEGLIAGGVSSTAIELFDDPMAAVEHIIDIARAGDLIILMTGRVHREQTWQYITQHVV